MSGIGQKAAAFAAAGTLLAGIAVGGASAATSHHQSTKPAATNARSKGKTATKPAKPAKGRDESETRALRLREMRGPGSPREERNESHALQRKELRNHAEVRKASTSSAAHKKTTGKSNTTPKTAGKAKTH